MTTENASAIARGLSEGEIEALKKIDSGNGAIHTGDFYSLLEKKLVDMTGIVPLGRDVLAVLAALNPPAPAPAPQGEDTVERNPCLEISIEKLKAHWGRVSDDTIRNITTDLANQNYAAIDEAIEVLRLLKAQLAAAEARAAKAEAALKPFAKAIENVTQLDDDDDVVDLYMQYRYKVGEITAGDLIRAKIVLERRKAANDDHQT